MPTVLQPQSPKASDASVEAYSVSNSIKDDDYIKVNDGPMLTPQFQALIFSPPSSDSTPLKFSASLHSMLLIDIESLCLLREAPVIGLRLKVSSQDFSLNQDKLNIVLKAFPGIESLSITADAEGKSLPIAPPVMLFKLEYLELRPKSLDPLVTNLSARVMFNWGAKAPSLKEYKIFYSTDDLDKGSDKYILLEQIEIFHRNARHKGVTPFKMGLNVRCWVQDSRFLKKLIEIKAQCKWLRIRVDDSCGCGNYHRGPFQEELEEFLKSQSECLEELYLHTNMSVTTGLKFPPMKSLKSFNILPFKFVGNPKSTPVFQPLDPGTFPALEYLKVTQYYERHEIFTSSGGIDTLKELVLQRVPQEMFLEKWDEVAPNLEKLTIGPISKEHLKGILLGLKGIKELTLRTLDMSGKEFGTFFNSGIPLSNQKKPKPIPTFKNLENLERFSLFIIRDRQVVEAIIKGSVDGILRPLDVLSILGDVHKVTEEEEEILGSIHGIVDIRKTNFLQKELTHCNGKCCDREQASDSDSD